MSVNSIPAQLPVYQLPQQSQNAQKTTPLAAPVAKGDGDGDNDGSSGAGVSGKLNVVA